MKVLYWIRESVLTGLFISTVCSIYAQPNHISQEVGIWYQPDETHTLNSWKAQWIWTEESLNNDMIVARRVFELTELPEKALLHITASSQYQLYVNDKYVGRGPARSAPHHQYYDIFDIQGLLQKGNNCIAVRVHHQKNKHAYHFKGRAGLLAQLELKVEGKTVSIFTDNSWKVSGDPAWDNSAPVISRFQMVVNDRVDLRRQLTDWNTLEYDDNNWTSATPLMREVGWPLPPGNAYPQALTPPWTTLLPRDVPYLLESEVRAVNLMEARQMDSISILSPISLQHNIEGGIRESLSGYQQATQPLIIPAKGTEDGYFLLFDFGKIHIGYPQLELEGVSGTEVDVLYAPYIVDDQFSHKVLDSDFHDKLILSGERDIWEATYFKPTRYLGLCIKSDEQPVKMYASGIRSIEYPFEQKGLIRSTDAGWVDQYMEATAKTIKVCTTDGYTDNYRERRQYAQTGYYAALGNYWLFGDHALQRRYLVQVAQEQEANGIMPAYAPLASDDYMIILDSNCLWLRSLRNYLLYSGDEQTVRKLLPAASRLLDLLHSYTDDLGLLSNPPYPYWLDHSLIDRRGANFCLNGHYLGALEEFAEILDWLGETGSETYGSRASQLRKSLRDHFWDEQKGLFSDALIDGDRSDQFSEHANAMALAEKVATEEQAQNIIPQLLEKDELTYTKRASGMIMVTPAMSYFLHKGLCEYDHIDASFELFRRRFDKMLEPQYNGTLWEEWWLDGTGRSGKFVRGKTRSDAQTESAFPPALFAEYLLGITPTKPGWKTAEITFKVTEVKHMQANIPTPEGILQIEWDKMENRSGSLSINIPGDMEVILDPLTVEQLSSAPLIIDGDTIASNSLSVDLRLGKGKHMINF